MTVGIYHGERGIPRSRVVAFVRSLGYDPERVSSLVFTPWHVTVTALDFIDDDDPREVEHEHPITPEDDAPQTIGGRR